MTSCRCCNSSSLQQLIDLGRLPIAHHLLKSRDEIFEVFPLSLHVCDDCGLVQVTDPIDPEVLYRSYNFNFSSWKPEPQFPDEVNTIMLHAKPQAVLEVGANDGRFLNALREQGLKTGVGIEPNSISGKMCAERGFPVYSDMLTKQLAAEIVKEHGNFDVFIARQVVEHLLNLDDFLTCAEIALKPNGAVFISVPDVQAQLERGDLSMFWEEHVNYFTRPVLIDLLRRRGFDPISVKTYDFSGGCLSVLARRGVPRTEKPERPAAIVTTAKEWPGRVKEFGARMEAALKMLRAKNYDVVMYGAGVRACPWANILGFRHLLDAALDDQKERQGLFLPYSLLPIVDPASVAESDRPLICLLAVNNESEERVMARFSGIVRRPVTYATLCAPKDIWADLARIEKLAAA
jgi:SAM-dependent methyltransferase